MEFRFEERSGGGTYAAFEPVDGEETRVGFITWYDSAPGVITVDHTIVPPAYGGRGVATALLKHLLEDAKEKELKIVPLCPFVARYFSKHPEEVADFRAN